MKTTYVYNVSELCAALNSNPNAANAPVDEDIADLLRALALRIDNDSKQVLDETGEALEAFVGVPDMLRKAATAYDF